MFQQLAGQQAWQETAPALTPKPMPLPQPPSQHFCPLFSLSSLSPTPFPLPTLPTSFPPRCCISHPLCPLHLVPFPFPSLAFVLSLSLSLSLSPSLPLSFPPSTSGLSGAE